MTRDADTPIPDLEAEPSGGDPDGAQPEHTPPPAGGSAVRAGGETDNNQPLRHGVAEQTPNLTARDDNTPRSVADQTVPELGGRTSILARQRADHQRLDRLMRRARETAAEAGPAHAVALRAMARLVFTHAFAEEAVLFPAARRSLPEGDPLTLRIETRPPGGGRAGHAVGQRRSRRRRPHRADAPHVRRARP